MAIYQGGKSLLPPSAYKQAVAAGYTGSAEEFAKLLATLPTEEDQQKWNEPDVLYVPMSYTHDDDDNPITTTTADFQETLEAINQGKTVIAKIEQADSLIYLPVFLSRYDYIIFSGYSPAWTQQVAIFWNADQGLNFYTEDFILLEKLSDFDPLPAGTASPGTLLNVARADHVHPKELPDGLELGSNYIILSSSTAGSTKKFKITVDDSGTLTATEVTTTT